MLIINMLLDGGPLTQHDDRTRGQAGAPLVFCRICSSAALQALLFVLVLITGSALAGPPYERATVGPQSDGRIVVPTNQVLAPLGRQIGFAGRPVDVALSPDGRWLGVLDRHDVRVVDVAKEIVIDSYKITGGSFTGVIFSPKGDELFVSTVRKKRALQPGGIIRLKVSAEGKLSPAASTLPPAQTPESSEKPADGGSAVFGASLLPAGLAIAPAGDRLFAAMNLTNELVEYDVSTGKLLRAIAVGNAPFDVCLAGGRAFVSNYGGRRPKPGELTGPAGVGSPVKVDPKRHIASEGSISVVDLACGSVLKEVLVGLHPCGLAASPDEQFIAVANANSDTVSVLGAARLEVVETISTRPAEKLLFGSAPNDLVFDASGKRLFVSNGTNNAIAVVEFSPPRSRLLGMIPTGWYPAGLVHDHRKNTLYVANVKGIGSRDAGWEGKRQIEGKPGYGYNSHDYRGTISVIPLPADDKLPETTQTVLANNRMTEAISALAPPRPGVPPRPVPERHGEPSVFKHVVYIIKENRTYDQVLGDMKEGNGDPSLCIFGEVVTPNHHKLAREFVLLDNFYCSGALSADGHMWATEAYVTDYVEKAFGGFPRSYPYDGGDALAYASSGFLWDNALAHGKTLRVYGEFVEATIRWKERSRTGRPTFIDCYRDFLNQTGLIEIRATATIKTLEPYICPTYIGFPGTVPDVYRANEFIREWQAFEQSPCPRPSRKLRHRPGVPALLDCDSGGRLGRRPKLPWFGRLLPGWSGSRPCDRTEPGRADGVARAAAPNLAILLLPNDHTSGTNPGYPTPRAAVADNDLALGRIVEAITKSKFWPETCIFVVEDDPQAGFDHVDGHRTVAFVISPYTKRRTTHSTNYNQTSMVRTIELILGLPPMNQLDASAMSMAGCFTDTPDFSPYHAAPNRIPLDTLNPLLAEIKNAAQLDWAKKSLELSLDQIDEADEDTLNRILWHAVRGSDDTYPSWAALGNED